MEFMLQFDTKIMYIKGDNNTVADMLYRLLAEISSDSMSAMHLAYRPYDYCEDDEMMFVNVILLALLDCPLFCVHALVETNIVMMQAITTILSISNDVLFSESIVKGYKEDKWCKKLIVAAPGMSNVQKRDKLLFIGNCLLIPAVGSIVHVTGLE